MVLGIDIGTSGVKSTIVDFSGRVLAHSFRPLKAHGTEEKKRELCPREVGESALETAAEAVRQCRLSSVSLVTIASLGEAVVPVAADGTVLMNSIVGSDPRGGEEMEWMLSQLGEETLARITGLNASYIYSLNKILYIKKHFPEIHARVWKYLCFTDYMGYLLTGEARIDYSMASRTMAFDIHRKQWSERILETAGLYESLFSSPAEGGAVIGEVRPDIKERLGLGGNIPVMAGSHDHIFNALGAGAVSPGICSNTVGTTEGITTVLRKLMEPRSIMKHHISCEPFVRPDMFNTVAWHNTAGAMVSWYLDTFYQDRAKDRSRVLEELGQKLDPSPSSLMVVPHFSGSVGEHMDEKAKGGILGLRMTTGREEIYKAVLEGASYECRMIVDSICQAGIPVDRIIVNGGGSRSPLWLKIKANLFGREIYRSAFADTGALGGAMLGAVVTGCYRSLEEAYRNMIPSGEVIEPDPGCHRIYEERYGEYKELYQKLKSLNHQLV